VQTKGSVMKDNSGEQQGRKDGCCRRASEIEGGKKARVAELPPAEQSIGGENREKLLRLQPYQMGENDLSYRPGGKKFLTGGSKKG